MLGGGGGFFGAPAVPQEQASPQEDDQRPLSAEELDLLDSVKDMYPNVAENILTDAVRKCNLDMHIALQLVQEALPKQGELSEVELAAREAAAAKAKAETEQENYRRAIASLAELLPELKDNELKKMLADEDGKIADALLVAKQKRKELDEEKAAAAAAAQASATPATKPEDDEDFMSKLSADQRDQLNEVCGLAGGVEPLQAYKLLTRANWDTAHAVNMALDLIAH
eukprot:TRINITY_DN1280_c0_g1_i1.p1 TRINITY_DN1280_c0_g1~~TRINITY_DN1280_c0_g1_i1.p1  ORF type:complete len:227 (-),score=77.99 TRINITY_DN1280_c0_g1_i1:43-723(-)